MNQTGNSFELNEVLSELAKKDNLDALLLLVDRLPEISNAVKSLEEISIFTKATLEDKQSLEGIFENAESKLATLGINNLTIESIITLINLLPQVVLLLKNTLEGIQFISGVLNDHESVQFLRDELEPAAGKVKGFAALMSETNKRCAQESTLPTLSVFKLVSLLKDENIRKGYKYLQTFLAVLSEKNSRRNQ